MSPHGQGRAPRIEGYGGKAIREAVISDSLGGAPIVQSRIII